MSMHANQYFCIFIDQRSRLTYVVGIKKGQATNVFKDYKVFGHVKKYHKTRVQRLHTDCGGKYKPIRVMIHTRDYSEYRST